MNVLSLALLRWSWSPETTPSQPKPSLKVWASSRKATRRWRTLLRGSTSPWAKLTPGVWLAACMCQRRSHLWAQASGRSDPVWLCVCMCVCDHADGSVSIVRCVLGNLFQHLRVWTRVQQFKPTPTGSSCCGAFRIETAGKFHSQNKLTPEVWKWTIAGFLQQLFVQWQ